MVKSNEQVIHEFNQLVSLAADQLDDWLKSSSSSAPGQDYSAANKVADLLRRNPDRTPSLYTEDDIRLIREVVSYNQRSQIHQEHLNRSKAAASKGQNATSLKLGSPSSPLAASASSSVLRSDVSLPTALKTGRIGAGAAASLGGTGAAAGNATASAESASEYLDRMEESVNKTIDTEVETLVESFKELISLATIGDKDKFRIGQETFQAEARADSMVRSAQSLSLISESLKLSLLLSKSPDPALNDEAIELIKSTELAKLKSARSLERILGLQEGQANAIVESIDDPASLFSAASTASTASTTATGAT